MIIQFAKTKCFVLFSYFNWNIEMNELEFKATEGNQKTVVVKTVIYKITQVLVKFHGMDTPNLLYSPVIKIKIKMSTLWFFVVIKYW